jgi:ribulose-5-phosphate 4-epimerase/fuculose-1-phosphate aldolase
MAMETSADPAEAAVQAGRVDLAAAFRLAVLNGFHEAIDNHFTLTVPGRPWRYLLNPFGLHWSEVRASDLLEIDLDGTVVAGAGMADRSAVCIHGPVHARGHACVLHTHMPYATALTQLEDMTVEMTGQNAFGLHGRIAYDYDYGGLALDMAEGERIADLVGDNIVLMMANHGVLVCGVSVADAFNSLYFLEQACRTQILSMSTGQPRRFPPEHVVRRTAAQFFQEDAIKQAGAQAVGAKTPMAMTGAEMHFAALKRILDKSDPG